MRIKKIITVGVLALVMANIPINSVWAATELSKDKIIEIAKAKALERGVRLDSTEIIYDEGNKMFTHPIYPEKTFGLPEYKESEYLKRPMPEPKPPKLEGKNYQAVHFVSKQGKFWVLIDRNTGEVIDVVGDFL